MADGYNTNLASEFFVLSCMHRLGLNATLTLGNKKGVDIVVVPESGLVVTVDVKGLAGKTGWPIDNVKSPRTSHFIVFVCYCDNIVDLEFVPEVYVVPSKDIESLTYQAPGGRKLVRYSTLRDSGQKFKNAWNRILDRR